MVELGCGIAGVLGMVLARKVGKYVLTDQEYVRKVLGENLAENLGGMSVSGKRGGGQGRQGKGGRAMEEGWLDGRLRFVPLDWETDRVQSLVEACRVTGGKREAEKTVSQDESFDLVIASDCIYNEALVGPFVSTLRDLCALRRGEAGGSFRTRPTLCIVAQQLRSPEVMTTWVDAMLQADFCLGRAREDEMAGWGLGEGSGFVVHFAMLA